VEDNRAFAEKYDFPFRLLSDPDRAVGLAYGACDAPTDGYPRRYTFMIGPDGSIERAIDTQDPAGQAADILESM
jgi:peroxiredoxin Q/BCP